MDAMALVIQALVFGLFLGSLNFLRKNCAEQETSLWSPFGSNRHGRDFEGEKRSGVFLDLGEKIPGCNPQRHQS